MKHTQQGAGVTLEMTYDEWQTLLLMIGRAIGSALRQDDKELAYKWLRFANEADRTNPHFTPYEIPAEFAG